jgi:hypothetical protein
MKKILCLLFVFSFVIAKAQTWQWLAPTTSVASYTAYGIFPGEIVSDKIGNTFCVGSFSNNLIVSPTITLTSVGDKDIYIIKKDPNGNALWAKRFGGTSEDVGIGITLDKTGNIIISGRFKQTMPMGTYNISSNGGFDVFIAKLDNNGNTLWAKSFGGPNSSEWETGNDITTDTLNNIYVTGHFYSNTTLAPGIVIAANGAKPDMFVLKMDASGNYLWAKKGGSSTGGYDIDEGVSIKISHDQNSVIIGGTFQGAKFIYGTDTIINYNSASSDSYLISLNPNDGSKQFIRGIRGAAYTNIKDLDVDLSGNIYVTGYCEAAIFVEPSTQITTAAGAYRIFIFKYDPNGIFLWSTCIGNTTYGHESTTILINHHNKILVCGHYGNHIVSGPFMVTGSGMFLATLDTNKTAIDLIKATTALGSYTQIRSMAIDTADNVYFTGMLPYGLNTFGAITYTAPSNDLYIAKYGNPTNIATGIESRIDINSSISIYPNPSSDLVNIISDKEITKIVVCDLMGRVIDSYNSENKKNYNLCVKNFSSGVYLFSIHAKDGSISKNKVIIE